MGTINRVPKGLLSILDGQTMGDNPSELSAAVVGTLPMLPLYLAAKGWETIVTGAVFNPGTQGIIDVVTVPVGQFWLVRAIGCYYQEVIGAAYAQNLTFCVQDTATAINAVVPLTHPLQISVVSLAEYRFGDDFPSYISLSSGHKIMVHIGNVTVGNGNVEITASISRFVA